MSKRKLDGTLENDDNEFGYRAELVSSSNGETKNKRTRNKKTCSLFFISKDTIHGAFVEILVPVDGSENSIECEGKGVKLYLMKFGITLDERYLLKMPNFGYFYFVNEVQKDMMVNTLKKFQKKPFITFEWQRYQISYNDIRDLNLFAERCNEILINEILREKFDLILHRNGSSLQRVEKNLPAFNGFKVLIDFKLVKDVIEKKDTSIIIQIVGMLGELREEFCKDLKSILSNDFGVEEKDVETCVLDNIIEKFSVFPEKSFLDRAKKASVTLSALIGNGNRRCVIVQGSIHDVHAHCDALGGKHACEEMVSFERSFNCRPDIIFLLKSATAPHSYEDPNHNALLYSQYKLYVNDLLVKQYRDAMIISEGYKADAIKPCLHKHFS